MAYPKLIREIGEVRRIFSGPEASKRIVFYSEGASYWSYFSAIIERLIDDHGHEVTYLTSGLTDPALGDKRANFHSYYIGGGFMRSLVLMLLRAEIMVMTTPDLGKAYFRKSRYPVHYAYVPHNMTSTHMVFRERAFNEFDTIFCVGPHQLAEHREAERIYGLAPRNLVAAGYTKLDDMAGEAAKAAPAKTEGGGYRVVIAPTWGEDSLFSGGCDDLIEGLLDAGFELILRPHRDTEANERDMLDRIDAKFAGRPNFLWARDMKSDDSYFGAHALITDWSGSAFSFAFGACRPVLFIDTPKKINNSEFARFKSVPLEISLRSEMGEILATDAMGDAPQVLGRLCAEAGEWSARLIRLRETWCYNIGDAASVTARALSDQIEKA